MRSLFDVNLLVALYQPEHIHHAPAHDWWEANGAGGWSSCPLTENGFVRVVSQLKFQRSVPVGEALSYLGEATIETDHHFWPDDISLHDERLFNRDRILGPKQLTDVYLLGLAVKNGGRLATFDRTIPIAAVRGAEPRHLAVL